jgi:hypothetical protein
MQLHNKYFTVALAVLGIYKSYAKESKLYFQLTTKSAAGWTLLAAISFSFCPDGL